MDAGGQRFVFTCLGILILVVAVVVLLGAVD